MTAGPSLHEAAGGTEGVLRLAQAWHARLLADEVASHPFQRRIHPQHTQRLAAYWDEALGGPPRWTGVHGGESDVVRLHSGNGEHDDLDRRAVECFDRALDDVGLTDDRVRAALHDWFVWSTANVARYRRSPDDVPAGLVVQRWSWDGLQA